MLEDSVQSHFIDWNEPFLTGVVGRILHDNALGAVNDGLLDLSDFLFVFPSGLAMRSFEEKLAREAEKLCLDGKLRSDWFPPKEVVPVGELPEFLYEPRRPFAEKPALLLAWREALGADEGVSKIVFPNFPPADDFAGRLDIAAYLARLYEEVATEALDFSSPQKYVRQRNLPEEVVRWNALCAIQEKYYKTLGAWGMCDKQRERLDAVLENRVRTDKTIVLVGTADLNNLQKKILEKVKERTVLFIQAPEGEKDLFDDFGCVRAREWESRLVPIPREEAIVAAPDTVKEGQYAACYIHSLGADGKNEFKRGRVAVGLLDPTPRPYLSEKLAELGIEAHFGEGKPFASGRVALLLRGASDYLRTGSYDDFSAWIRHPDVEAALRKISAAEPQDDAAAGVEKTAGQLAFFDRYQNEYVPRTIVFSNRLPSAVRRVFRTLFGLSPEGDVSFGEPNRRVPLSEYPRRVSDFLAYFYPDDKPSEDGADRIPPPEDEQIDQGLEILYKALDLIAALSETVNPELTAGEAIDFILRCASGQIREETADEAVDVTGWLDTRFAETPNLILVGMNEGIVPESRSSDIFLPDTVRTEVNIENNRRHYARDAYYLTTVVRRLTTGGKDGLRILFARGESDGTSISPSRLLFAEEKAKISERVARLFGGGESDGESSGASPEEGELSGYFPADPPKDGAARSAGADVAPDPFALPVLSLTGEPPKEMNVTSFSSFLRSPYRYFLEKIYGLETVDDSKPEFETSTFGNIAHGILYKFGAGGAKDSADENEIKKFLFGELDRIVEIYKRAGAAGTALLQLELIRLRLEGFARWQARWRRAGNEIAAVEEEAEVELRGEAPYDGAPAFPFTLKGKIDRIDYNRERDQWFVFDYKTFDKKSETGGKDGEDLAIRLNWLFAENGFDPNSGGAPGAEYFPAVNIREGNTADGEHRNDKQTIFPAELACRPLHWKNLQLPLYTLLAEKIIGRSGRPRGAKPLTPGYILLKKDNIVEANFPAWSAEEIGDALLTARWVRRTIVDLWKNGKIDPNAPVDPNREDQGRLCEPDDSYRSGKKNSFRNVLRDFPD